MRTRVGAPQDIDLLLDWMTEFNRLEGIDFAREPGRLALSRLLADNSLGQVLIAEREQELIGYAVVTWGYDLEFAGRDAFLTEIYLEREQRGRGYGKQLLAAAETAAKAGGARALHLGVRPDNGTALALYRGAGFQPWTRLMFSKLL